MVAAVDEMLVAYRRKCEETTSLRSAIETARLDGQRLRLQLGAATGEAAGSNMLVPSRLSAGGAVSAVALAATAEHRTLLEWLASIVDMSPGQQAAFNAPGEVQFGAYQVTLGHMVQWPLSGAPGGLKLSVPSNLEQEFQDLLLRARRGVLDRDELLQIAAAWEFIGAEVASEGELLPAIFMVQRETQQAVVVASWPPLLPPHLGGATTTTPSASFDPAAHFSAVQDLQSSFCAVSVPADYFSATATAAPLLAVTQPPLLSEATSSAAPVAGAQANESSPPSSPKGTADHSTEAWKQYQKALAVPGDHVEVNYEGQWFSGVLQCVKGELAHVHCDVDLPFVTTIAHLSSVRPAARVRCNGTSAMQRSRSTPRH